MSRLAQLWRTSTVRLTATFILIFVVFAVLLLGFISYRISIEIQRQQADAIEREVAAITQVDRNQGFRAVIFIVERLARQPGPGIYYLASPLGEPVAGNVDQLPVEVLQAPGAYSFDYERVRPQGMAGSGPESTQGNAVVRSVVLPSGLLLVVGRDVVERRGFTALIFGGFAWGVAGILVFSLIAGLVTSLRVLRRIDSITSTANAIMAGSLSERIPVTRRNDEFDGLATSLNRMLDRIEQLMQGLKEVTDNVAHDLKTPLTRLRNKVEAALREGKGEEAQREALETTLAESEKLIKTFNALLMIARAEAGAPSGALADVDLSAVAQDVAELYGPVAEEAGMTLETRVAEGVRLHGNRELLGQALVNLVENALKYFDRASGRAGLIIIAVRAEQGRVRIEVSDNGPGIPAEDRERVLQRFVRLESNSTEPGSGLGLALVAAVARLHGGHVRIEDNAPGVRVVMDLPAG
ncbi:MAG TPA: HAMP domain-containing histidine kinase [Alphaproteobacteria bacterium]|nr:HAMP domain-containing histidine kinase [Alphaproteobacteria bacterium]